MKMILKSLLAKGLLVKHKTSAREIADLFNVVNRDIEDAEVEILSNDRRFATAYNASLQLATIVLHAAGYRVKGIGHHENTIKVLPEIMGIEAQPRADYLNNCRSMRNRADYDNAGRISKSETEEIIEESKIFREDVIKWLTKNHPHLI